MFPKLKKRSPQGSSESASDKEDDEATDYVFRIIYPGTQTEFGECRAAFGGAGGAGTWHWWAQGKLGGGSRGGALLVPLLPDFNVII